GPPQFFDVSAQSVDDGDLASFPPNVQTFAPRLAFADDEMSGYPRGYPTAGQMLIFRPIDCSRRPANPRRPADYVIPGSPRQLGRNFGVVTKAQPVARRERRVEGRQADGRGAARVFIQDRHDFGAR